MSLAPPQSFSSGALISESEISQTMLTDNSFERPQDVGIIAIEVYFPKKVVDQTELEEFDKVSSGKYTIGLGQERMGVVDDREDINSLCLTVVQSLMEKYSISYADIGRLEVGTETIIDKSKSVKSVLMQLFEDSGNTSVEGLDTTNACYGGTNALFNSLNWVESSSWDGRLALVVAADIAVYKQGSARPTGGVGAVAMLIGPDAPLVFDRGLRSTHMEHAWDFYKPDLHSEYPEVDGPLSNVCYLKAVDVCYNRYLKNLEQKGRVEFPSLRNLDYFVFHCPYSKLVQKSFARLAFNDFLRNPLDPSYAGMQDFANIARSDSYANRDIEKAFMRLTEGDYKTKVLSSLVVPKNVGNMYCASVYGGLVSLLGTVDSDQLLGKRVVLFSYGSGLAASMFSLKVKGSVASIKKKLNVSQRLADRTVISPDEYDQIMHLREKTHNVKSYTPSSPLTSDNMFPGTYYLVNIDEKFRRSYERFPAEICN